MRAGCYIKQEYDFESVKETFVQRDFYFYYPANGDDGKAYYKSGYTEITEELGVFPQYGLSFFNGKTSLRTTPDEKYKVSNFAIIVVHRERKVYLTPSPAQHVYLGKLAQILELIPSLWPVHAYTLLTIPYIPYE